MTGWSGRSFRRYHGGPEATEDLMQVGYVGLLKAINNYDPEVGDSLSAYAQPCVSGEIKRHFRDKRWQVHVRRAAQELLLELRTAAEELTPRLGREPADAELADTSGSPGRNAGSPPGGPGVHTYSLDAPMSDRDDRNAGGHARGRRPGSRPHLGHGGRQHALGGAARA